MHLVRITPPAADPVSLAEAKAHLRVDHSDDDALISRLIKATVARLDGDGGLLGRAIITQSWELHLPRFTRHIQIPLPPLISIDEIEYRDAAGVLRTMPVGDWWLQPSEPATLISRSASLPDTQRGNPSAALIGFTCGYGSAADVPEDLKHAILVRIGTAYEARESALYGTGSFQPVPDADDALEAFRIRAF